MQLQPHLAPRRLDQARRELRDHRVLDARQTIERQAMAIAGLAQQVDQSYGQAVDLILATKGRLVICGMGKSGLIARKLVATFSSTGTPSLFLHPADALHGDLGMVTSDDTVMLLSNSGETTEVVRLLPLLRRAEVPIIALVGRTNSTLSRDADIVLQAAVESEVCPNGLAPTTSTLAAMALGDALAVTLIRERSFTAGDFAQRHPGGNLGRALVTKVRDEMRIMDLPIVHEGSSVADCVCTMTAGRLGLAVVLRKDRLVGIVTDGDLRRSLPKYPDLAQTMVSEIMTPCPKTISPDVISVEAEARMQREKVKALIVVDDFGKLLGVFDIFRK